jgi:flagellar FliL protein
MCIKIDQFNGPRGSSQRGEDYTMRQIIRFASSFFGFNAETRTGASNTRLSRSHRSKAIRHFATLTVVIAFALTAVQVNASTPDPTAKDPLYIKMRPNLVVNVQKGASGASFVMLTTMLRAEDRDALAAVEHHMPVLRHHLIMLLSTKTSDDLVSLDGKQALRAEAERSIESFLKTETGREKTVKAVYFTEFVLE